MPNPRRFPSKLLVGFTPKLRSRMAAALGDGETLADLVRASVEREVVKREREAWKRAADARHAAAEAKPVDRFELLDLDDAPAKKGSK